MVLSAAFFFLCSTFALSPSKLKPSTPNAAYVALRDIRARWCLIWAWIYTRWLVCCLHRRRTSARNGAWWRDVTSRQPSMVMAFDRVSKHPDPYGGRVCSDLVHGRLVETCRVVAGRKKFPIDDIIGSRNDYTKHRGSTRHTTLILTAFPNV